MKYILQPSDMLTKEEFSQLAAEVERINAAPDEEMAVVVIPPDWKVYPVYGDIHVATHEKPVVQPGSEVTLTSNGDEVFKGKVNVT